MDGRGLVLVEGVNHDSPTASSNGAGKSSIYEALFWGLYGKTKRGLTGDDVINEAEGKNCWVEIEFDDYRLTRFRKCDSNGSGLRLERFLAREPGLIGTTDLTKGTIKDTQALLESILRMSDATFNKVASFGQGDVKAFASLTDAELKQVFEQALGITYLTDYFAKARAFTNAKEAEVADIETQKVALEMGRKHAEEKIVLLENASKELEAKYYKEKERYEREIGAISVEISTVMGVDTKSLAEIENSLDRYEALIHKRRKLMDLRADLLTKTNNERQRLATEKVRQEIVIKEAKGVLEELKKAEDKVGSDCGECGKEYAESDIAGFKASLMARLIELRRQIEMMTKQVATTQEAVKEMEGLLSRADGEITSMDDVKADVARLTAEKAALAERERQLTSLRTKRDEVERMIAGVKAEIAKPRSIHELIEEREKVVAMRDKVAALDDELEKLNTAIADGEILCDILGNQGLKSYIFDTITPELNRLIQEYMGILNPSIGVEISTVSKLKSGEFREKFGIKVKNANGSDSFDGSSGGEKQIINLAVALGFNAIVRGMSGGACNVLFLDEPFESLDEAACERAVELCGVFSKRVPSVFLISHNPAIKDLVGASMLVEKRGGAAKVA